MVVYGSAIWRDPVKLKWNGRRESRRPFLMP